MTLASEIMVCPKCFGDCVGVNQDDGAAWCNACGWAGNQTYLRPKAECPIERRTHVLARRVLCPDRAGAELWFVDGMAVWVSDREWYPAMDETAGRERAVCIVGATVTLEFVGLRWRLAEIVLAEGA